jgi:hypothetical protein
MRIIKVGPFAMVDMYGTPHTEALHVVERYRLLDYESANESEDRGKAKIFAFGSPTQVSSATQITRAPDCCSNLQLRTRACSQPPGQPELLIGARWAVGRNSSALKARSTMWAERSTFRMPTNQISEISAGRSGVVPTAISIHAPSTAERRLGLVEAIGHPPFGRAPLRSALGGGKMIQIYLGLLFSAAVAV